MLDKAYLLLYPFLPFCSAVEVCPPHHLLLNLHIKVTGNDRLMAVLHIILRYNAIVLDPLLGKEIHCVSFLQEGIPDILLVPQYFLQRFRPPLCLSRCCQNAVCLQAFPNLCEARPFQVFPVNPLYNLCPFRLNNQLAFLILCISKETVMVDLHKPLLVAVLQPKLHILA